MVNELRESNKWAYDFFNSPEWAETKGKTMKNFKSLQILSDTANKHASTFGYDSAVRFQVQLAKVVLPTSAIERAQALEELLQTISVGIKLEILDEATAQ